MIRALLLLSALFLTACPPSSPVNSPSSMVELLPCAVAYAEMRP